MSVIAGALLAGGVQGPAFAQGDSQDLRFAPGETGILGAWLVSGPFDRARAVDE